VKDQAGFLAQFVPDEHTDVKQRKLWREYCPMESAVNKTRSAVVLRKWIVVLLIAVSALMVAETAQSQKVYYIASLNTSEQFVNAFEGFRNRMAELGYRPGQNVRYGFYNSKGDQQLLKTLAEKVVEQKPDMIVTSSTTATIVAAKAAEGTRIPIVFLSVGNAQKVIKSFASAGANLAGISSASMELVGKRLDLLRELSPKAKRIAMPIDLKGTNYSTIVSETNQAAGKMGFSVWELGIQTSDELSKVSGTITRKEADAIFFPPDSLISDNVELLMKQAIQERLPAVCSLLALVKRGCLGSYAADYTALGKQGAMLADKIFKGTKPSDLPVELPYKLNLGLNLKTAKAIDLKVPKEILLRADQVVE
jgi:putative ABC transport system substrate-binding protein